MGRARHAVEGAFGGIGLAVSRATRYPIWDMTTTVGRRKASATWRTMPPAR